MLKIKLARFGKRNQPHYRFVVIEAKSKRDGEYTENLGFYAPTETPKVLEINVESYDAWVKKGAQPTETVKSLVTRFKSGTPFPAKAKHLSKKAKAKQSAAAAESAVAETAPAAEAPASEAAPVEAAAAALETAPEATVETSTESK